ncbi:hypothetical protein E6Q11_04830 [Candidatus Dojkabacteria bacterium]|uniref:Uncharacterized protein n=1 Tax=Candidatus Dojkabacteria bacterium TaxID=2099670 RepID=A0A5C7J4H7_9BACT|nr:MAG: hypothetical protein E6Q11_04830 [Candidatus Dojkabacteria bacterium]
MKQVTRNAVNTFNNKGNGTFNNTKVVTENGVTSMFLFGNKIAEEKEGILRITNAGWESNTTKERLNALNGVQISQKNFVWYLNGEEWNGNWKQIN